MIKLGDAVSAIITPIVAHTTGSKCIDVKTNKLLPESKCHKRVQGLNTFTDNMLDVFFPNRSKLPQVEQPVTKNVGSTQTQYGP